MPGILVATVLGVVLGLLGARATILGAWTLLPWALGGVVVGYKVRRHPVVAGALYGFALSFVFMLAVYTGNASVLSRVPFFALLGLVGAACGASAAAGGRWLARRAAVATTSSPVPPDDR